ncbi:16S rRNA (cytosine(967)-C(5))-methyltransferase RsmB [Anaerorhabdus sp.]|uniref:16S rRNA (cytosine(967)-C(5))-methyltransferase RsmB n=1 Tax=Anaerorhabdus sp. TaxID=1872524 RepID=UPI002FC9904A
MNARSVAYDCLCKIILEGQYANLMMRKALENISDKDKGFVTQIVYGTLRNYRLCRYQWVDLISTPCDRKIAILLDMSVYQLFFMDKVPTYAILNEAVDCAAKSSKGFVNAILRKVEVRGKLESSDIGVATSHPEWLLNLWKSHYGQEQMEKIAQGNNLDAQVVGRLNTYKCNKEEVEQMEGVHFLDELAFVADFNLVQSDLFKEGKIVIQDESSQQVVKMMDVKEGMRVLDCCSAPGTKTSQIAMMMNNTGEIIANELHEHRAKLVEDTMSKLGFTNTVVIQDDALNLSQRFEEASFDAILVDAPCSGLGVLRRKPEIKSKIKPENIDEIVQLQANILDSVQSLLKKQGVLVYSTCTLNKKENEKQIEKFLKNHEEYELICEKTIFPTDATKDGFYMAKVLKKG